MRILLISLISLQLFANNKTICGSNDDRELSDEKAIGRLNAEGQNAGCSLTMISKTCAVSAGHCKPVLYQVQFNTPLSTVDGAPMPASPEDTYMIDQESIVSENGGRGNDWAVMKVLPHETTGAIAGEVQGFYNVNSKPLRKGIELRITGYGRDEAETNFTQQTHTGQSQTTYFGGLFTGVIAHTVDTMGGNSGSTIRLENSNEIIGVHTHGGCFQDGGTNFGTLIAGNRAFRQAIQSCLDSE